MRYILNNNHLKVIISDLGATLVSFIDLNSGVDMVLGYENDEDELSTNSSFIKEVFSDNFEEAFKEINSIKNKYNYIGMDTEFPGIVYNIKPITKDFYYKTMKTNVNGTKLIQLGISFSNKNGEFPEKYKYHTWQFNFLFDKEK